MQKKTTQAIWEEKKQKLKKTYPALTDGDLIYKRGKADQLVGRLQKKLGKNKAEVRQILKNI